MATKKIDDTEIDPLVLRAARALSSSPNASSEPRNPSWVFSVVRKMVPANLSEEQWESWKTQLLVALAADGSYIIPREELEGLRWTNSVERMLDFRASDSILVRMLGELETVGKVEITGGGDALVRPKPSS